MAFTLKLLQNGQYALDTQDSFVSTMAPKISSAEFEAYSGQKSTAATAGQELVGSTNLAEQTQKVLRETPGQYQTVIDPITGETKTTAKGQEITQIKDTISTLPKAQAARSPRETSLDKVQRILGSSPAPSTGFNMDEYFGRLENIQKQAQKAQTINTLIKAGGDIGMAFLKQNYGGFKTPDFTPLTGGSFPGGGGFFQQGTGTTPTFSPGVGAGLAAAGTFLQTGDVGKAAKAGGASYIGGTIGTSVGGPVGGAIGSAIGAAIGCFLPDTLITMSNGSTKKIIDIDLKDNIAIGGKVFATGKFLVNNLYDYKGVKVSGSHLVNENNKWLRVEDSKLAISLGNNEHIVYTLGTDNRRILINNILFTDYFEVEDQNNLFKYGDSYFTNWQQYTKNLSNKNINILNKFI